MRRCVVASLLPKLLQVYDTAAPCRRAQSKAFPIVVLTLGRGTACRGRAGRGGGLAGRSRLGSREPYCRECRSLVCHRSPRGRSNRPVGRHRWCAARGRRMRTCGHGALVEHRHNFGQVQDHATRCTGPRSMPSMNVARSSAWVEMPKDAGAARSGEGRVSSERTWYCKVTATVRHRFASNACCGFHMRAPAKATCTSTTVSPAPVCVYDIPLRRVFFPISHVVVQENNGFFTLHTSASGASLHQPAAASLPRRRMAALFARRCPGCSHVGLELGGI